MGAGHTTRGQKGVHGHRQLPALRVGQVKVVKRKRDGAHTVLRLEMSTEIGAQCSLTGALAAVYRYQQGRARMSTACTIKVRQQGRGQRLEPTLCIAQVRRTQAMLV